MSLILLVMFKSIDKYRKSSSGIFLAAYFAFILITAIHFHHYNLDAENCFKPEKENNNSLALDFLADGTTICAVSHFSHSILNISFSSSELFCLLPQLDEEISTTNLSLHNPNLFYLLSPRASPLFS